jgi:pfkB family carbohydrate kinase
MGKRTSQQAPMFVAATELPVSPGHPFYAKLNTILDGAGFDRFAEEQCQRFYAPVTGAGDALCAALGVSLLQGRKRGEALARAGAAGAIEGSRPGAQPSLPTAAELEEILAR